MNLVYLKELLMIVNAYALGNWLGAASFSSAAVEATSENVNSKDEDTVFVAGATGRVGSRTVRLEPFTVELDAYDL